MDERKRRFFTLVCLCFSKKLFGFQSFCVASCSSQYKRLRVCVHARFILVYRANHYRVHWQPYTPVPRFFAPLLHTPIGNDRVTIVHDCTNYNQSDRYQSGLLMCVDSNDTLYTVIDNAHRLAKRSKTFDRSIGWWYFDTGLLWSFAIGIFAITD